MSDILIVDARMGRGKSSAAIEYVNRNREKFRFLYVTPYLSEVERIRSHCNFQVTDSDEGTKLSQLKELLEKGESVAITHALFLRMSRDVLELVDEGEYHLIIDESLPVIQSIPITKADRDLLINQMVDVGADGLISWRDEYYRGVFDKYKELASTNFLYYCGGILYEVMRPSRLSSFKKVTLMTYLFDGQIQKAYLDYFDFTYQMVGVLQTEVGFVFSDKPDNPPPLDLLHLITIVDTLKMNQLGVTKTALSKSWFRNRKKDHQDISLLKKSLQTFFNQYANRKAKSRIWTTFKENHRWLLGDNNRYATSFVPLNTRATNAFKEADAVAYLVNRFPDPNLVRFFATKGVEIDQDLFALSEMVQFIWRSAIRDNKPITLYIPSKRMRSLLLAWMIEISKKE